MAILKVTKQTSDRRRYGAEETFEIFYGNLDEDRERMETLLGTQVRYFELTEIRK